MANGGEVNQPSCKTGADTETLLHPGLTEPQTHSEDIWNNKGEELIVLIPQSQLV